jgi:hypothetical protein
VGLQQGAPIGAVPPVVIVVDLVWTRIGFGLCLRFWFCLCLCLGVCLGFRVVCLAGTGGGLRIPPPMAEVVLGLW